MHEVNLGPILYKRLRIQGSTLRSRSVEYQADLINRLVILSALEVLSILFILQISYGSS